MRDFIYYYDETTDTVRRYKEDEKEGERWDKKESKWSHDCCQQSACRWDTEIQEIDAEMIIKRQT